MTTRAMRGRLAVGTTLITILTLAMAPGCAQRTTGEAGKDAPGSKAAGNATAKPPLPAPEKTSTPPVETIAPHDDASKTTDPRIQIGIASVELFFGAQFPAKFEVEVLPHRADFDAYMQKRYGGPKSECWMVATGVADGLAVLDPAVWKTEACEHDGSNTEQVQRIITHELFHVFHGQKNPTRDFTGMDDVGWFCEGLACYASGQLDHEHLGRDIEAVRSGAAPKSLATAWSGKYRYAVCGSLVRYVDKRFGRETLLRLLAATKPAEFDAILGIPGDKLLADWIAAIG